MLTAANVIIIAYFCRMGFLYLKAAHIVFVVSWFAALFYIVRLFIYTTEAQIKKETERDILTRQLLLMQKKLWYIIGWPAMIGTYIFGWWMIYSNPAYLEMPWMHLKLTSVLLLTIYHLGCHFIFNKHRQGIFKSSSYKLRLYNELATVLLVAIVFLAVVKSTESLIWGIAGLLCFAAILMAAVFLYKKQRKKTE
jgi:putative membrane protein